MHLYEQFGEWNWRSRSVDGPYDFGDEADFRRGVDIFTEMVRNRYSRCHRLTMTTTRGNFGWRSILYRMRAWINLKELAESEIGATGWDRSDYSR